MKNVVGYVHVNFWIYHCGLSGQVQQHGGAEATHLEILD